MLYILHTGIFPKRSFVMGRSYNVGNVCTFFLYAFGCFHLIVGASNNHPQIDDDMQTQVIEAMRVGMRHYHDAIWPAAEDGENASYFSHLAPFTTTIDALDTMWIMGLRDEFEAGVAMLTNQTHLFRTQQPFDRLHTFEFIIRNLGGLLGAATVSDDPRLMQMACQTGKAVISTLIDLETLYPQRYIIITGWPTLDRWLNKLYHMAGLWGVPGNADNHRSTLASVGTNVLEFRALSDMCSWPVAYTYAQRIIKDIVNKSMPVNFTVKGHCDINIVTGESWNIPPPGKIVSHKGNRGFLLCKQSGGDSFFESIGKLGDKQITDLIFSNRSIPRPSTQLECFWPGYLVQMGQMDAARLSFAACLNMSRRTATGLPPNDKDDPRYELRPEIIESFFWLWLGTGDAKEEAWLQKRVRLMWRKIVEHCRRPDGTFSSIANVFSSEKQGKQWINHTHSFFYAETLKYLYLLTLPKDKAIAIAKKYIFTTEAHLLSRPLGSDFPIEFNKMKSTSDHIGSSSSSSSAAAAAASPSSPSSPTSSLSLPLSVDMNVNGDSIDDAVF